MVRSRTPSTPRLTRDTVRLITLAIALDDSGSYVEKRYWENQLSLLISKLLRSGKDRPLETALERLSQTHSGGYEVLIEQAETLSESAVFEQNNIRYDLLLIVAPLIAWTRYTIPTGKLPVAMQKALEEQLQTQLLAENVQMKLLPWLVSIDQMPRTFSETWNWLQNLGAQALGATAALPTLNSDSDTINMLADTRYIVGAVATLANSAIFKWQENPGQENNRREVYLQKWGDQTQQILSKMLPGCEFECLLPDAYFVGNREADRRVRPLSLRAAVCWLESTVNLEASQLRAVIAGCGEKNLDEYRIGFTARNSNDVFYGCLWPIYGREYENESTDESPKAFEDIVAELKKYGVTDVRRILNLLPPEYCEDCTAPHFPNPLGEMVHAELPEDANVVPAKFH